MSLYLELPVSIGEAIDKLTILDIKCDKITDNRKVDVEKEYSMLMCKLEKFITKYPDLYNSMKKINLSIWHQMDILRDHDLNDKEYGKLSRECVINNDIRFRIKNKINLLSNSLLKEQKSYKTNTLVIELECNENITNLFIRPIKYYSLIYDEIIIISPGKNVETLQNYFNYDTTIKFNVKYAHYKKKYILTDENYTIDEVLQKMELTETILNDLI